MNKIKYKTGSLFDAEEGHILIHACNSKGVWGSGIAKQFKDRFPNSYLFYNLKCTSNNMVAKSISFNEKNYKICSLITSSGYSTLLDSKNEILVNTTLSLQNFIIENLDSCSTIKIASNKFNSGLFKVPWNETESILEVFVKRYNLNWTVYG